MISQPMRNKTEEQIRSERAKLAKKLAKSIDAISKVDAVIFMNGWQNARGCEIEHKICQQYGKLIMYEHELYIGVKNECKC